MNDSMVVQGPFQQTLIGYFYSFELLFVRCSVKVKEPSLFSRLLAGSFSPFIRSLESFFFIITSCLANIGTFLCEFNRAIILLT